MNSLPTTYASPAEGIAPDHSLRTALLELTKARLTVMVLLTTLAGYALAHAAQSEEGLPQAFHWLRLFHTLFGTALVAVCSSALNQALERGTDARMTRTADRPFVTHRLPLVKTLLISCLLGVVGLVELVVYVNALTAGLAVLTLVIYVAIYTPLKRVTALNTLVGAIPGALPPLLGTAAVREGLTPEGWALFGLLAAWQLPHFYAIAWLYKDDYQQAGLKMISAHDPSGVRTGLHALVSALVLVPVSFLPNVIGHSGVFYAIIAALLNLGFVWPAVRFFLQPDQMRARCLFFTSIAYLPLILTTLALDIPVKAWLGW